jgi:hypothetical protein
MVSKQEASRLVRPQHRHVGQRRQLWGRNYYSVAGGLDWIGYDIPASWYQDRNRGRGVSLRIIAYCFEIAPGANCERWTMVPLHWWWFIAGTSCTLLLTCVPSFVSFLLFLSLFL